MKIKGSRWRQVVRGACPTKKPHQVLGSSVAELGDGSNFGNPWDCVQLFSLGEELTDHREWAVIRQGEIKLAHRSVNPDFRDLPAKSEFRAVAG